LFVQKIQKNSLDPSTEKNRLRIQSNNLKINRLHHIKPDVYN
jgi:hypothetical protein